MGSLRRENAELARGLFDRELNNPEAFEEIITANKTMRSIFHYCEAVAVSRHPVPIVGETGVGKELIARAPHRASRAKAFS